MLAYSHYLSTFIYQTAYFSSSPVTPCRKYHLWHTVSGPDSCPCRHCEHPPALVSAAGHSAEAGRAAQRPEQSSKVKHKPVRAACVAQTCPHTGTHTPFSWPSFAKSLLPWVSPAPGQRLCGAGPLNLYLSLHSQQKKPDCLH